jgi:hypothetical protein
MRPAPEDARPAPAPRRRPRRFGLAALLACGLVAGCATSPEPVEPPAAPVSVPLREAMQAGPVGVDPLFWRVAPQGGATLHVLGSIHFGPIGGWRMPRPIEDAYARSTALVVEVDDRGVSPEQMQAMTMRYALAPRGTTLQDLLPPETFELLERKFAEAGATVDPILPFRPWMIATLLTVGAITETGFAPSTGVDRVVLGRAGEREVIELESIEIQLAVFGGLPPELDALFLTETLEQLSEVEPMMLELAEAWRVGDEAELAAQLHDAYDEDDPAHQEFRAMMFTDRNISMAEQLAVLATDPARSGDEIFVVVGAGHFVGDDNVLEMLTSKGLEIARVGPAAIRDASR